MKIKIEQVEVKVKREDIYYFDSCCHNMERVIHKDPYNHLEMGNWDDLRRAIKEEIDTGKYSIVKYCPYCGAKIEWEGGPK